MKLYGLTASLFVVLSLSTSALATDWSTYAGCYKTVTYNGQPTHDVSNGQKNESQISVGFSTDGDALKVTDENQNKIPAVRFDLFISDSQGQGDVQDWTLTENDMIFTDRGTFTDGADGEILYDFSGPLMVSSPANPSPQLQTVTFHTVIQTLDNQDLKVTWNFKHDTATAWDNTEFVLRRTTCQGN